MSNGLNWFTGLLAHELDLSWALMASAAKWTERTLSSRFFSSLLLSTLLFSSSARNLAFSLRRVLSSSSCIRLVMHDFDYNHDLDFVLETYVIHHYDCYNDPEYLSRVSSWSRFGLRAFSCSRSRLYLCSWFFRDIDFALFCVQHEGIISNSCIFTHLRVIFGTFFRGIISIEILFICFRGIFSNHDYFINHDFILRFLFCIRLVKRSINKVI